MTTIPSNISAHAEAMHLSNTSNYMQSHLPLELERLIYSFLVKKVPKEKRIEKIKEMLQSQYRAEFPFGGPGGEWIILYHSHTAKLTNSIVAKWDTPFEGIVYDTSKLCCNQDEPEIASRRQRKTVQNWWFNVMLVKEKAWHRRFFYLAGFLNGYEDLFSRF